MSDIPTKTYPPSFLRALIADHEAERAGATPEGGTSRLASVGQIRAALARAERGRDE